MTTIAPRATVVHPANDQLCARIRDVAIATFGAHGFRTPLRVVAAAAKVDQATVLELFGSERGLLTSCDDHVVETGRDTKAQAVQSHDPAKGLAALAGIESYAPLMAFLLRRMEAGRRARNNLLDRMIQNVVDYLDAGVGAAQLCREDGGTGTGALYEQADD